jgi:hypothetical protein
MQQESVACVEYLEQERARAREGEREGARAAERAGGKDSGRERKTVYLKQPKMKSCS